MSPPDATAQAELIRRGEVYPKELVEQAIQRIEKLDPEINAVVARLFDEALAFASKELPDRPFKGVPILFKDLAAVQKGMPLYHGNGVLRDLDHRAPANTIVGSRLRDAGFIPLGKTSIPEFGLQPTTQPLAFGPCRNPWDPERSTSGSSGGSAAAVASGMVAIAHATDGGGSIRNPAAWCGVVGMKPSRGRVPRGPNVSRLGQELVVSRTVRDTAAALDALAGASPGDLYGAPLPGRPYIKEVRAHPGKLRIGLLTRLEGSGVEVDPVCVREAERVARRLSDLGHEVSDAHPERLYDDEFWENAELDYACLNRQTIATLWKSIGRELSAQDFEPYTWARLERVRTATASQFIAAGSWLQRYSIRIISWWSNFDLLVTPTNAEPPALLDTLEPDTHDPFAIDKRFARVRCFARPFNVTGQPAISLPLGWTEDGLPVGIQIIADLYREDLLIRVASQLEEAEPWINRVPKIHASTFGL